MIKKKINFIKPVISSNKILTYLKKILKSSSPNEGNLTRLFENKISKLLNVKYVVATTSGTAAIFLALKALNIKKKDEVLVPNLTFAATINAVNLTGAKPVLVDINKKTLLYDLDNLKKKITKKTKAIIPVHISGRGSNIKELIKISKKFNLKIVEDAAEAFLSKYKKKPLGTFGEMGCFSFSPPKMFTTGQGGVVITNNFKYYKEILKLKNQGRVGLTTGGEDKHVSIGYNFKFTNLQSALGLAELENINWRRKKLVEIHKLYKKNLIQNDRFKLFNFNLNEGELPLWTDVYSYDRNKLNNFLLNKGIECRYFWHPLNYCKPYKQSFKNLQNSKILMGKLMWLPSSLSLSKKDILKICKYINQFHSINYG